MNIFNFLLCYLYHRPSTGAIASITGFIVSLVPSIEAQTVSYCVAGVQIMAGLASTIVACMTIYGWIIKRNGKSIDYKLDKNRKKSCK